MRNFLRIASGINVAPLLLALASKPELWNADGIRTMFPGSPHHMADDILLRFNRLPAPGEEMQVFDDLESVDYPAYASLPEAREIVSGIFHSVRGERLGRAVISCLAPGARVEPHADEGLSAEYYDRFHVVLQSNPEAAFRVGDEVVNMAAGEVWWIDNQQNHEVVNSGECDRIHLIIDARLQK